MALFGKLQLSLEILLGVSTPSRLPSQYARSEILNNARHAFLGLFWGPLLLAQSRRHGNWSAVFSHPLGSTLRPWVGKAIRFDTYYVLERYYAAGLIETGCCSGLLVDQSCELCDIVLNHRQPPPRRKFEVQSKIATSILQDAAQLLK